MAQDFVMVSGDSKTLRIGITDDAGVAVDVSTAISIRYEIATSVHALPLVQKTLIAGISVDVSTVIVELAPADTDDLVGGSYYHELQIIDAAGKVFTPMTGDVLISADLIV